LITTVEKRVEDEQQFRLKNEEDIRKYFENKFLGL
jgi:hypothetical protein